MTQNILIDISLQARVRIYTFIFFTFHFLFLPTLIPRYSSKFFFFFKYLKFLFILSFFSNIWNPGSRVLKINRCLWLCIIVNHTHWGKLFWYQVENGREKVRVLYVHNEYSHSPQVLQFFVSFGILLVLPYSLYFYHFLANF